MSSSRYFNKIVTVWLICLQITTYATLVNHHNSNATDGNSKDARDRLRIPNAIGVDHERSNRTCEEFCASHSLNKLHADLILNDAVQAVLNSNQNDNDVAVDDDDENVENWLIDEWIDEARVAERRKQMNRNFLVEEFLKKSSIIFGLTKTVNQDYVSRACYNQLQEIKRAILHKDIWGIKVLDASGAKKSGFLWGNNYWFGSKKGCEALQTPVPITLSDQLTRTMKMGLIADLAPFAMEYRVVYIKHNSPWQVENKVQTEGIIHLGLCIPKVCSNDEIHNITQNYVDEDKYTESNLYEMNPQIINVKDLKVGDNFFNKKSIKLLGGFILFTVLMFLFSGCLSETITSSQAEVVKVQVQRTNSRNIEMRHNTVNTSNKSSNDNDLSSVAKPAAENARDLSPFRRMCADESGIFKFIKCFDIVENWKALFFTENLNASSIPIINGLRSISCMWIICFHVAWYMWFTVEDQTFLVSHAEKFLFQYISSAPLLVDVFFTISGFLLTYKFMQNEREVKAIAQNGFGPNAKIFVNKIFHRYIRLAPPSFAVIGVVEIFSAYSENVSIFHLHERNDQTCAKYWWRNFLFIQNFFNLDDMCLNWTWSLACEMQFFILTLFMLIVYTKNPQKAKNAFVVGFVATIIWSFVAGYRYQYQLSFDIAYNTRTHIYINPFLRVLPYFLGVGGGWYLATTKGEFDFTEKFEKRCWYLSLVVFFVAIYSTIKRDMGFLPTIALMVIGRILFAISVCWMIIGSATGRGVWWSRILEGQMFQHVNKLSYCMYLLNPLVIFIIFNLSSSTTHTDPIMMSIVTIGVIVIVYVLSIFFTISFEMPYCNLSTYLLRRKRKTT